MNCEVKRSSRSNQCVICGGKDGLKIIYKGYTEMFASYAELIFECFCIQFPGTHLGKDNMLCKQCIKSIRRCMDFRNKVEIAHKRLYGEIPAKSSVSKDFKIDKAEMTIKPEPWTELKAEPDDDKREDNDVTTHYISDTENIQTHNITIQNLLAVEIETLSKIKEEFDAMDYSDDKDTFHYSDNNDMFHNENEKDSDSSSVKTDEIFRATGYKGYKSLKRKHKKKKESFSIPKLEPTETQCPLCQKQFLDNNLLKKHHETHYPAYICHICGKTSMRMDRHKNHLSTHSNLRNQCDSCEKTFKNSKDLDAHKKVVHLNVLPCVCPHCKERFGTAAVKTKHLLEVHGIKPTMYKCPRCDAEFNLPCYVRRHMKRKHLKSREYHCQICYSSFFESNELNSHILAKHDGIRCHKCELCDKTYAYAGGLRTHLRTHHNHKGYECQLCGESFVRQHYLKRHLKTHEPSE